MDTTKTIRWKSLFIACAVALAAGGIGALLGADMSLPSGVPVPALMPSGWVFPVAWTILYLLMGIASYLVWHAAATDPDSRRAALLLYGIQLVFNMLWNLFFFRLDAYVFAFLWLAVLWGLILLTMIRFFRVYAAAGYLLLPYLLWVTFAGYLNYVIAFGSM